MRKKFMAGMLAATLAMGMNTAVFANVTVGDDTYSDASIAILNKIYTLTNKGTTSPAETFSFSKLTCTSVTDADEKINKDNAPVPKIESATYAKGGATVEGEKKAVTITLPEYTSVGVYTYTFKEIAGNTAGVTYRGSEVKLVVTVMNDENGLLRVAGVHTEGELGAVTKSDEFENTYSAGSLSVKKNVTGTMGDKKKDFEVTVTFTAKKGTKVSSEISYVDDGVSKTIGVDDWSEEGVATAKITLKNDETVTFDNIPYEVEYSVAEGNYTTEDKGGYETAVYAGTDGSDGSGTMNSASEEVTITNKKDGSLDTGINLDSMPYLMMMGVACAGMFTFFTKKRMARED